MYVRMSVCLYVSMFACMPVRIHVCMHSRLNVYMYVCLYVCNFVYWWVGASQMGIGDRAWGARLGPCCFGGFCGCVSASL